MRSKGTRNKIKGLPGRLTWSIIFAATSLIIAGCSVNLAEKSYVQGSTQYTQYGQVGGTTDKATGNLVWKGIRFARAPVGDLRWKAPREPDSWRDVKEAKDTAPNCIQGSGGNGEEDCLFLDIYRPDSADAKLPVYVWIHGGANSAGSAPDLNFFAKNANIVAVSIRYRLGPLGFFKHDALNTGDPLDDSGNYGLLDQMMALKWVKTNIRLFGGDPNNVTAAGESAGAHNILAMLMSKYANGLFHKAIYQSGGMEVFQLPKAKAQSDGYVKKLQLTSTGQNLAKELRALEAKAILKARPPRSRFGVIADRQVIPDSFYCLLEAGKYNKIPIIMGGNKNEFSPWFGWGDAPIKKWTYLRANVSSRRSKKTVDDILTPDSKAKYAFANDVTGRLWQASKVHAVARSMRKYQDTVYVYDFRWGGTVGTDVQFVMGAAHANEIAYFNYEGNFDPFSSSASINKKNENARKALAKAIRTYLAQFLHTGNPNGQADLPKWKPWSNKKGDVKALNLDASSEPGSSDLNLYMTQREYLLLDIHEEIDDFEDQKVKTWLKGLADRRNWNHPLCSKTQ